MKRPRYKRIVLKISGEVLTGERDYGIDPEVILQIAQEIKEVAGLGLEVAIVIGGGNIFRGVAASSKGMDRASADYMGMLATVLNGLALQNALEKIDVHTRVQTAIEMREIAEPYIRRRAMRHLEKGRVVIFAAGTGNPFFTTDTASALRAVEIGANVLLKGTRVDGVYNADPEKDPKAKKFNKILFDEAIALRLKIMDSTAFTMCRENNMPIIVFDMNKKGNLAKVLKGTKTGTLICN